jgi:hypothetical protein
MKELNLKPRINKANGQINFSLPKRKVCKEILDKIYSNKPIKFLLKENG